MKMIWGRVATILVCGVLLALVLWLCWLLAQLFLDILPV